MPANVIGVVSGKGGVGKTTVVSNLGISLARDFNIKTVVVDCNVLTSNLGLHLGLIHVPITLHDIFINRLSLSKATYVHSSGLHIIPSALSISEKVDVTKLQDLVHGELEQYNTVILDSAPGLSQEALSVIQAVDNIIVVTNPELPAVTDAIKTIDIAEKFNKHIRGVVLNRVTGADYELTEDEIERICGYQIISKIPYDRRIPESVALKTPAVMSFPKSPAARELRRLGAYIAGREFKEKERKVGLVERLKILVLGRV